LEKAEKTAKDIELQRKSYKPIAVRGSIIYFVIASLANVDSMYNYSLEYFSKLFNQRLEKSEPNSALDKRVKILIQDITISFYEKISRGIFEQDKLLYAFLITINILIETIMKIMNPLVTLTSLKLIENIQRLKKTMEIIYLV